MTIEATADTTSHLIIDCGQTESCTDLFVDIDGDFIQSNTNCYGLNACDRMRYK